jgi:hypothetical protein
MIFLEYFNSEEIVCPWCGKRLDLFKVFTDILKEGFDQLGLHYSLIGCEHKFEKISLKPHELYTLDISERIGDGELLYISYTPEGGDIFPLEHHSNTPQPHINQETIYLYGKPQVDKAVETKINISYWIAPAEIKDDVSLRLLVDAFKRYYEKNYQYMVISAFTAVEIVQNQFFTNILNSSGIGKEKVEPFLKDHATFSYQFGILLPLLVNKFKLPKMGQKVYDGLMNLKTDRDNIVHSGEPKSDWDINRIQRELIAALFAFKYYKLISIE